MNKHWLLVLLLFLSTVVFSQQQFALLIGIDKYEPPRSAIVSAASGRLVWPNLAGCKNDALSIKAVITSKFGFAEKNIRELYDEAAGRAAILTSINSLLQQCKENDIAFIYYAGHGSQVKNSLSAEADKKDESIVPADTWKAGVGDIRDKELAAVFNRFIDNKIKLTVIFDCCHSGSIARGLYPPVYRYIQESNYDARDNSRPVPPESRPASGYLILSAAQANEYAQEQLDEQQLPHGAFTLALIKALNQQASTASAENLFASVRALLKSNGKSQEPVLAGDNRRFTETIFGLNRANLPANSIYAVIKIIDSVVILQGGYANGLNAGNELTKLSDSIKIKITRITGINQCEAVILNGNSATVKPGEMFEVSNWVASTAPLINIYVPRGDYKSTDVQQLVEKCSQLKRTPGINFVTDLGKASADLFLNASENKISYTSYESGNLRKGVLTGFTTDAIAKLAMNKKLFVNLPLTADTRNNLIKKLNAHQAIRVVEDPAQAQYILFGTLGTNDKIAYGFLKADVSLTDSLASMPISTKTFTLEISGPETPIRLVDDLYQLALKLCKIRGWQTLSPPVAAGFFPYHLAMRNKLTGKVVDGNTVKTGDQLSLTLEADDYYLSKKIETKFLYVFAIDINGNMQLLYPSATEGNSQNQFPFYENDLPVSRFILQDDLEASEPAGTDNYFLIASKDPILSYQSVFTQEGVRGMVGEDRNPLASLLQMGNESQSRGQKLNTPANWHLLRLSVKVLNK